MTSWFILDLVSTLPIGQMFELNAEILRGSKVIKLLRFIKLIRIIKVNKISLELKRN